jgi:hypothetical protein
LNLKKTSKQKNKDKKKTQKKNKPSQEVEYIWVKKEKSKINNSKCIETRGRGKTFNSSNTKDTNDERIPDVDALTKMLELQKQFEKNESSPDNNENVNFEKILNSQYSNSSFKTNSLISESDKKFDTITPEKNKIRLVVDLSEIRKKLDFESEIQPENSDINNDQEGSLTEEEFEDNDDAEFDFIINEIDREKCELDSQENEFNLEDDLDDFELKTEDNEIMYSPPRYLDFSEQDEERFILQTKIDQKPQIKSKKIEETNCFELENSFIIKIFENQEFLENYLIDYEEERIIEEAFSNELSYIKDLSDFLKENDYFDEYFQIKKKQHCETLGKINKYYKYISEKAIPRRRSLMQTLCPMNRIDSLFSMGSSANNSSESKKDSESEDQEHSNAEVQEDSETHQYKAYKKTIVIKKCQTFFNKGICMKGEHCPKLHISSHSKYKDLKRCVINILKGILRKHNKVSLENLLNNFNKMKPALEAFTKIMYRKPEVSIFDEIFDQNEY